MPVPCEARCINQRDGRCLLEDERIKNSRVEFGDDWDPVRQCIGYLCRDDQEFTKRRTR
ncbi:MAG TPA: hypothetical protein PKO38_04155 [Bacillota bacterium]|nr:hypothetical protein [Bacillota bacterium]HOB86864.1 hypothetical protein [Bacillota bacterium]HOP68833.1 hypothetical protein [Bacillota bacterium]HPT34151.1 hypothetical protein [Bacillota bacterium]HPZ64018.1 hypothetical protein [Bacillota bacterium]